MPITVQALKKQRHDRKRTAQNAKTKFDLREIVKSTRKHATAKGMSKTFSVLDKAVKTKIIHKNKAARLKSRLSKLLKKTK